MLPWSRLDFSTDPARAGLRLRQAAGMRRALEEAGGGFVKAGQMLSTRTDILPEEWALELSHLQRDVTPAPWGEVEAMLVRELGGPLDSVFREFDREPMAAASIAQVHRAVLRSGREVAVKIQRPGIAPRIKRDISIVLRTVRAVERTSPRARELRIAEAAEQYMADLGRQLDFRLEASNLQALRTMHERGPRTGELRLPELLGELSGDRVVVMELLEGRTLSEVVAARRAGAVDGGGEGDGAADDVDLDDLLRRVLRAFVRQVVIDGVYHSDLHPGNILVLPDGRPALVDFGSVGRLDLQLREAAQDLLIAYLQSDSQRLADGVLELSPLREGSDEAAFRRELASFVSYRLGPGSHVDVVTVDELVAIFLRYGMAVPADIVAAVRGAAILEGTLRTVLPAFDLIAEARGIAREQIGDQLRPSAIRELLTSEVLGALPSVRRLPRRIDRIGAALEQGRLSVNVRLLADARDRRFIARLVRRTALGIGAGSAAAMSIVLLTVPPPAEGGVLSTTAAGVISGVSALGLAVAAAVRGR
ncbi:ABC1 kinase family protein [Homoserinibacter sp. YIM 151385]|uniref:ABC1 kinase family protein n=1 Tax=Homoserinibacter sp. YIM 151385 TaxID=2985506 RepID=UPI0022F0EB5B|nr:AarF/UbiB family protein [Homoserinibacter sp. YIM 151385]WBU37877.1 AarF/UbiB family protein [Homoserinibacter sp. YIM 151385]